MVNSTDIHNASILIVDDLEANIRLLENTLRSVGYEYVTATMDPFGVCALHTKNRYDLIVLDLKMPGMDGFQVMEALKDLETDEYLPVIVVTAEPAHKLRALQAGAKDFISKPFDLAEVQVRIYNMLEVRLLHKEAREYGEALESFALHDPLTGLANRRLLAERASLAIAHARRNKTHMAVVFMDLDGFKQVNDTWGHDTGDELLRKAAERLLVSVRQEDTVARFGGDEFAMALWQVRNAEDAAGVAAKLVAAISRPVSIQNRLLSVSASAGAAIYPLHGEDLDTLLKSADLALYEAKRAGKNAFRISERTDFGEVNEKPD